MPDAGTCYVKLGAQGAGSEAASIIKFTVKTVKLNVFLDGNTTAKPNSTLSVKVTINKRKESMLSII